MKQEQGNTSSQNTKLAITNKLLCQGAFLSMIAVILQAAPILLPTAGMVFSPFATFPIALAALLHMPLGVISYVTAAILLLLIDFQEALIFIFTTGLLGVMLGSFSLRRMKTVGYGSLSLALGICIPTYVIEIDGFQQFSNTFPIPLFLILVLVFAIGYTIVWYSFLQFFIKQLRKRNLNQWFH